MKNGLHLRRGAAILACTASLAATAVAVAPTAASAAGTTCPNKTLKLPQEGGKPYPLPVKAITVFGGVSCAEAYKVILGVMSGEPPTGWKSSVGHFDVPEGLYPSQVKKGGKKIQFATQGG